MIHFLLLSKYYSLFSSVSFIDVIVIFRLNINANTSNSNVQPRIKKHTDGLIMEITKITVNQIVFMISFILKIYFCFIIYRCSKTWIYNKLNYFSDYDVTFNKN